MAGEGDRAGRGLGKVALLTPPAWALLLAYALAERGAAMKRHPLQWERPLWQYAPVAAMLAFQAWLTFRFWRRAKLDSLRLSAWMAVDCCALAVALCSTLLLAPTMVWFG